jgi:organic hydroperoxide reductase OsmC/OhrA
MAIEHHYRASLVWTGAEQGSTSAYESYSREYAAHIEGKPSFTGSADPTFRGDPGLHNPEDLLVIALSACHLLSYLALCARAGIRVLSYADEATGTMARQDGKVRFTDVVLHPRVVIAEGDDLDKAIALHHDAHESCFIANSVSFPVQHQPTVTTASEPTKAFGM